MYVLRTLQKSVQDGHCSLERAEQPGMYPLRRLYAHVSGAGDHEYLFKEAAKRKRPLPLWQMKETPAV